MVGGMPGCVKGIQAPTCAEVDTADLTQGHDPVSGRGLEVTEELIHDGAEDPMGTGDESRRIHEMSRALLVDDHLRPREGSGDIANAAGVVKMDVGDHHGAQVIRPDPQLPEGFHDGRGAEGCARLNETWTIRSDEVPRRNAGVSPHEGVDLEDVIVQRRDA